jgi:hypothetical protein
VYPAKGWPNGAVRRVPERNKRTMTMTERFSRLNPALKRIGGRLTRYAPGALVAAYAVVLTMAQPAAAQGLCQIPGASGPLSLGFGVLVSIIALVAVFKFGGSFLKALTGGGRGNAKLRLGIIAALVGLFVAVGADSIIPWLMRQLGGGPKSVNLGCMVGGGGGGGSSSGFLLLAAAPRPLYHHLRRQISNEEEIDG